MKGTWRPKLDTKLLTETLFQLWIIHSQIVGSGSERFDELRCLFPIGSSGSYRTQSTCFWQIREEKRRGLASTQNHIPHLQRRFRQPACITNVWRQLRNKHAQSLNNF